jgi:retinol-binding protein 3
VKSGLLRPAVACVRAWTWFYTWRMRPQPRETRRAEIESDLWEFQRDAAGDNSLGLALHVLLRLLIGIPNDLGWRVEQEFVAGRLTQTGVVLSARAAGAAIFFCALLAIQADTSGRRPAPHHSVNFSQPTASPFSSPPRTASVQTRWSAAMTKIRSFVPALLLSASPVLVAQNAAQPSDIAVDAAARTEVIDGALKALNDAYVFPDVAKKMEEAIRARQQRKEYDVITSGRQLAQILTEHLREVSHDLHLSVNFIEQGPPPPPPPSGGALPPEERQRVLAGRQNFGFARVERLAGNIGYLDLRGFMPPAVAGETATAAMTFLASTDAIIFDLRQNGGGDPTMVAFLTSYVFGQHAVHLNDFYSRPTNETRQSWTLPYVPGRRLTDKDVYILTSSRTFSGAEEFTYNLKHLKRAIVVGETTGGGAHTVGGRRINAHFAIAVPSGRPINAVTKTNWEGVGVEPDVKASAENALKVAHLMALEKQQQTLPADATGLRTEVTTTTQSLRHELGGAAVSIPTVESVKPVPASKASEDFESGTLANWRIDQRGAGGWFSYSNGKTPPNAAQSDPNFTFDVPAPPQGKFAAVTDTNGPGRRILYRDIMLDGRYRVHLTVFYVNLGTFSATNTSSRDTIGDEQQYRIDLVLPSAPVASLAKEHVLANIFQGQPSDPSRHQPTEVTFDLSPWAGQTVRLRLACTDFQGPLRAGVDNIRFERLGQ